MTLFCILAVSVVCAECTFLFEMLCMWTGRVLRLGLFMKSNLNELSFI